MSESAEQPVLRVLTPDTTPEEVAAIVAVFAAMGSASSDAPAPRRSEWNRPARQVRVTHRHGVDGWRSSGMPR